MCLRVCILLFYFKFYVRFKYIYNRFLFYFSISFPSFCIIVYRVFIFSFSSSLTITLVFFCSIRGRVYRVSRELFVRYKLHRFLFCYRKYLLFPLIQGSQKQYLQFAVLGFKRGGRVGKNWYLISVYVISSVSSFERVNLSKQHLVRTIFLFVLTILFVVLCVFSSSFFLLCLVGNLVVAFVILLEFNPLSSLNKFPCI